MSLAVDGFPPVAAIVLLAAEIAAVILLHEYVHVLAYRSVGAANTRLGTDRFSVFAWAEGWYVSRMPMAWVAAAPAVVISAVGLVGLAVVPNKTLGWVFIPVVVNAAAASGDYMGLWWLWRLPRGALVSDNGQTLRAFTKA